VYLAEDLKHHREVALKVLRSDIAEGLARDRFVREIRIAGRLQHPNIVPLFDSGIAEGKLFYVMPHVEGETLRDRLKREGRFEVELVKHILREIAGALAYAHARGVIHRDIKPENILLIDRRAVLTDFGIARAAHAARAPAGSSDGTLTEPGTSLGTPAYMAPEQAAGNPTLDQRADLYALGVLGYEMLAGQPPFVGSTPQGVLASVLLDVPVPISKRRPDVPAGLAALLMSCLEKIPANRPASAQAFLAALEGEKPLRQPHRLSRSLALRGFLGAAVVAGMLLGLKLLSDRRTTFPDSSGAAGTAIPSGDPRRIAVLYFDDLTSPKRLEHVASGLTEDLIDELSRVRELHVVSPNGVRPFKAAAHRVDSLAAVLGVGNFVTGSVTESEGTLRVTVRLVDGRTGRQIESRTLERPLAEVLAIRDTLAIEVAGFLRMHLGREVQLREDRAGTVSIAAWEQVQRAKEEVRQGAALASLDDAGAAIQLLTRADAGFRKAETLDGGWSAPTLGRARVALSLSFVSPGGRLAGKGH
jgi:serine/threonine-protein kinase